MQGGVVAEVLVREGDAVTKGTPLARLDSRALELQLDRATAALAGAQATYDQIEAGSKPEEVAQARARVGVAQAQLRQVRGVVTEDTIAAAQARLDQARATLSRLEAGPRASEVHAAQAALDLAKVALQATRDRLSATKTDARLKMERAANDVRDRQDAYNLLQQQLSQRAERPGDQEQLSLATRAIDTATKALQQATVDYDVARQAEDAGVQAANLQVRQAQVRLDQLLVGADADQIASARADVAAAQEQLSQLQGEQRAGALASAAASITAAEADLQRLLATPLPSDLGVAAAQIQEAQVVVRQAQLALDTATLRAPFDATVAAISAIVGEPPPADMPALVLADLSEWRIQTANLSELSIGRILAGDQATITFSALPDMQLSGRVSSIRPIGANQAGDVTTYTVLITPDTADDRLWWNMTASVTIVPGP
nr:HlyD family efflux transporter periplasmic adaptor subunit [Oscillochloris sp. ZM17-4]